MRGPWSAFWFLFVLGCASTTQPGTSVSSPIALARSLSGVPASYVPAFQALSQAVEAHDDAIARQILARTEARLSAERLALGEDADAGEQRALESAETLARGFALILDGRERVEALDLELVARASGEGATGLYLRVHSAWDRALALRTGPLNLREEVVFVSPLGRESRTVRFHSVAAPEEFVVESGAERELALQESSSGLPRSAIAGRREWSLHIGAGSLVEDGQTYPGMHWGVAPARVSELAPYLPEAPLEPYELVEYLERSDLTVPPLERVLPPIMERAVRILPEHREETLTLLGPFLEGATEEQIERAIPALRWLAGTAAGSDPLAWKRWARGSKPDEPSQASAALDLPSPGRRWR